MPPVPRTSPATSQPTPDYYIHTTHGHFVDNHGRTLLLRGVNLSGSCKSPVGQPSQILDGFWEAAEDGGESFESRPLNLDDGSADIHLARLRGWGYNMLRYVVTWESLEHEGPGKYDYDFMDYTVRLLQKCKEFGFKVYMDPHQDIWSRFSGGSGAPYWTLPACGLNPHSFTPTQSSILHCEYPNPSSPDPASLPAMIWSTNYGRLSAQTIFTLFFGGRDFAPLCIIDGINIQDWLQNHFIEAFGKLADRIREEGGLLDECVIGWDTMNEPFEGLLGWDDLNKPSMRQTNMLKKGSAPTPAQSFRLGMGQKQTVEHWTFGSFGPKRDGNVTIDPAGIKVWLTAEEAGEDEDGVNARWGWKRGSEWKLDGTCIWAKAGVWDVESGYIIDPTYFSKLPDGERQVEFIEDYYKPHVLSYLSRIRLSHPESIMFLQPPVFVQPPNMEEQELKGRCCYSTHYYDGLTLITRHWNWFNADALGVLRGRYKSPIQAVKIGEAAIRKSLREQLAELASDASIISSTHAYPTIIGEIGIPFDMDSKRSYGWTDDGAHLGDYTRQEKALDASLNGADVGGGLNWTLWTYVDDGSHEWGDGWNLEDLSLWCEDDLRGAKGRAEKLGCRIGEEREGRGGGGGVVRRKGSGYGGSAMQGKASAFSLATLTLNGSSTPDTFTDEEEEEEVKKFVPPSSWDNPYDFLTDGARAVRAFCRPYPVVTVGTPKEIEFSIAKAEFRCTVVVRSDDAPTLGEGGGKEGELATEIYVPLVHFGSRKLVAKFCEGEGGEGDAGEGEVRLTDSPISSLASSTSLPSPSTSPSLLPPSSRNQTYPAASSATLVPTSPPGALVTLDVQASVGRWEVEGQKLKWWYPVPAPGEPEREYSIVVKREGGPMKLKSEVGGGRGGGWMDVCKEVCAGDGCVVM
ncbi:glycoside hydrolase family 5 protein [Jaapia argillacea MUCL 33604]|uniref:Glycoside hydrolase family 5 protein n=1 Tax=Jaapia argillacea MUCL 33604 TaxID=933084 RepID=A0A067Q8J1_9AGAM|nr:glycoside hydrolase family 5 protein [Jaapia argillacea MUCL 33604]